MINISTLVIGIFVIILGFPIGYLLAHLTKEELQQGKKWFKLIIIASLFGTLVSLFLKNDVLLFSFLFIIIVTSISLKKKKRKR
jgi:uncharacterized membrane protein YfcA